MGNRPSSPGGRSLFFRSKVLLAGLWVLLAVCAHPSSTAVFDTPQGPKTVQLELARSAWERARGLMFRTRLEETQGMLFFFPDGERPSFWMKHTFLALDLLFLSKDGQVLDLVEQMPPCAMDPCPTYVSRHPAAFALELKGGFVAAHGVRRGDRVRLEIRD